jgi:hypothetical protein
VTARDVAVGTVQQQSTGAVSWQRAPHDTQNCGLSIGALQFYIVVCHARIARLNIPRHPHSFFNLAVVYLILPDEQVGDFSRIIETTPHKPGWDDRHALAVESRPRSNEVLMPSARLFPLYHRLIPVIILSIKVPIRGRVFKESVKVFTPKSPAFSDDSAPNFAAFHVFPHCSRAQTQNFRRFAQG